MSINSGMIDRLLRIIVGVALLLMTPMGHDLVGTPLPNLGAIGWVGVVPLATGLIGWCPAYSLIGVSTCKKG